MRHFLSSAFLAALLSAASAAPTAPQGGSFKVERVATGNTVARNGTAELRKAFAKYGWSMPTTQNLIVTTPSENAAASGTTGQTGVVTNTPEPNDAEFLSPVNIGGQTLMMDFDTGSSDLWVFCTEQPSDQLSGHDPFDAAKSTTFQNSTSTFDITFGDDSGASGTVGTDTVNIGGATVTSQAVELATSASSQLVEDTQSQGLVGLAFSSINTVKPNKQNTFFDNVKSSLAQPVLTANLKHDAPGTYEFGKIDSTQFQGQISYVPVDNSQGFWQFTSDSFAVGNGQMQQNSQASPAIADTGTTLLLADDPVVQAYYSTVPGVSFNQEQQGFVFDCNTQLPDLTLAMGSNYNAVISGSLLNFAQVGNGQCMGGLQSNAGQPLQIFGDIMFKSQFVVFDNSDTPQLGFAPHA